MIAFSSNPNKRDEALGFGAYQVVDSRTATDQLRGVFDLILVTANVSLDWEAYLTLLAPKGTLHFVGAVPKPVSIAAFSLIGRSKNGIRFACRQSRDDSLDDRVLYPPPNSSDD